MIEPLRTALDTPRESLSPMTSTGAFVLPPAGPVGRDAPTHLYVSTYTSVSRSGSTEIVAVTDSYRPSWGWTSCLLPGHYPGRTPRALTSVHGHHLDCACDVGCPRCKAPVGMGCWTLDGGGTSGGGYSTSLHAVRVKASPRCQALLDHSLIRCDLGDHTWSVLDREATPSADGVGHARCSACGRVEPLNEKPLPYSPSGSPWTRRPERA